MLKLIDVNKTFYPNTANEKKALQSINLTLKKGDFVTIVGSNGAGKSTLFNTICGNFLIDKGGIFLDGENITVMPDYKRSYNIGRIFQDPMKGTAPGMTIEENLCLAYTRKAKRSFFALNRRDYKLFYELLKSLDLGLEDRMKVKVGQLSGGQRQAVSLLMSTISSPKLLLLDEHTAALDPKTAEKVLQITNKLVDEKNITTMMITHNINSALKMGNRILVMDEGKIVLDISGEEKSKMTQDELLNLYSQKSRKQFSNDRTLFSANDENI